MYVINFPEKESICISKGFLFFFILTQPSSCPNYQQIFINKVMWSHFNQFTVRTKKTDLESIHLSIPTLFQRAIMQQSFQSSKTNKRAVSSNRKKKKESYRDRRKRERDRDTEKDRDTERQKKEKERETKRDHGDILESTKHQINVNIGSFNLLTSRHVIRA